MGAVDEDRVAIKILSYGSEPFVCVYDLVEWLDREAWEDFDDVDHAIGWLRQELKLMGMSASLSEDVGDDDTE